MNDSNLGQFRNNHSLKSLNCSCKTNILLCKSCLVFRTIFTHRQISLGNLNGCEELIAQILNIINLRGIGATSQILNVRDTSSAHRNEIIFFNAHRVIAKIYAPGVRIHQRVTLKLCHNFLHILLHILWRNGAHINLKDATF